MERAAEAAGNKSKAVLGRLSFSTEIKVSPIAADYTVALHSVWTLGGVGGRGEPDLLASQRLGRLLGVVAQLR